MAKIIKYEGLRDGTSEGSAGTTRSIAHSISNWFRTSGSNGKKGVVNTGIQGATNVAGAAALGGSVTAAATSGSLAAAAGLTATGAGAAATVVGSVALAPITGIVMGVVALGYLGYSRYSNRDKYHKVMSQYTWSLIDDSAPQKRPFDGGPGQIEAHKAADELCSQGGNQIALMPKKYDNRAAKYQEWYKDLENFYTNITSSAEKFYLTNDDKLAQKYKKELNQNVKKFKKHIDSGTKYGGAVWEYIRRLAHMSNYLQAHYVFSVVLLDKVEGLSQNEKIARGTDYFEGMEWAKNIRKVVKERSDGLDNMDKHVDNILKWLTENYD